jgi:predicted NUDIX family NTP pyrophosphohydrolase
LREFPEVDCVEWVTVATARTKLLRGQVPFLDLLMDGVRARYGSVEEGANDAAD